MCLLELLAVEAGARGVADRADLREVAYYVAAPEYRLDLVETLPLSLLSGGGTPTPSVEPGVRHGVRGAGGLHGLAPDPGGWQGGCLAVPALRPRNTRARAGTASRR